MLKRHFSYNVWLTFFFVVFLFSCRKEYTGVSIPQEIVAERFFNEHRTNSTEEKQLIDYLNRLNAKKGFVNKTVERIGFPRWDKLVKYSFLSNSSGKVATNSTVSSGGQDSATNYIIPFVRDTQNYVNAAMFIKTDKGDTSISYLCDWQYTKFRNPAQISKAEEIAIFFMLFDRHVHRHESFDLIDSTLFRKNQKKAINISFKKNDTSSTFSFSSFSCTSFTITYNVCKWVGNCGGYQGECDWCDRCVIQENFTVCDWAASVSPPGNDFGGGGTPPPSNGSGSNIGGSGFNDGALPPSNDDRIGRGWRLSGKGLFSTPPVFDPNNPFNNLENPINASDDIIIDNGVSITDDVDVPTNPKKIAQTLKRGNIEDMQHSFIGDPTGIDPASLLILSDAQLFQKMKNLFQSCTIFDNDLYMVGDAMIQKFQNKSGGQFINNNLNSKVGQSNALINFAKHFGLLLNKNLQSTGGDISKVTPIEMGKVRPIFNGLYNKFNGLQILINDTEYTEIQLDNFAIDGLGNWSADITITIHNHFGLDKNDALNYQQYHQGFPSWWLLQHSRDYIPFETIVIVRKKISSRI